MSCRTAPGPCRLLVSSASFCVGLWLAHAALLPAAPFEPPGPCSRKTPFVITEIMYNPPVFESLADGVTNRLSTEFIELYNSNPFFEDLSGYRLSGDIN